jgi:hypothetical protein
MRDRKLTKYEKKMTKSKYIKEQMCLHAVADR